jgi:N-methylhydantoinase B
LSKVDPFTLEVIRNALLTVTGEMKTVVVRTAISPLWKDAGDVSCAILTRNADVVAQGKGDIPVHLGTMPFSLKGILARIPLERIEEGDALIQNDPYSGGNTHLPDFLIAVPVFANGEIVAFTAVRGHWTSLYSATAREIYEEGLTVPPAKIYRRGKLNQELVDIMLANMGRPDDRLGDLKAQYGGCKLGALRVEKIIEKYGAGTVKQATQEIIDHSERLARAEIETMPDGIYRFTDYLDDNGVEDMPIKIQVAVTIRGSDVTVDFTGTDEQTNSAINNTYAAAASAAYYVIKCVTDPWNPVNSGFYRCVNVIAPEGSLVNCRRPAAMAAYHETQVRICDAVFGALAQAVPERVPAAGYGSQGGLVAIAGVDSRPEGHGDRFILFEITGGPSGGTHGKDGLHGTRVGTGNSGNIPVESVEIHNPIMIEAYEIVPDTCGAGKLRGGCSVRRESRILSKEATVAIVYERAKFRPWGLFGGGQGAPAAVKKNPGRPDEKILPAKSPAFRMHEGEVIMVQTAGGGGYGNPLEREPELVRRDVIDGLISVEAAEKDYGIVLELKGMSIDWQATSSLRESMRKLHSRQEKSPQGG